MAYDIDIATTPTQKAIFGLLRICTREQWDPDNLLVLTQAFEGLLAPGKNSIARRLHERLELVIGSPTVGSDWFKQLYTMRSRIIHGDTPVLRPGEKGIAYNPELLRIGNEAAELEGKAVAALLALLQDMVRNNIRAYRFEQRLLREPW